VSAPLQKGVDRIAEEKNFSGVVHLSRGGEPLCERSRGLADRAAGVPNTPTTRFGIASGTKGFTALAVMSLVADKSLALDTPVHRVLGDQYGLTMTGVTVGQLLAHTSGIGDYLDEAAVASVDDYVLPVPADQLAKTTDYLAVLRGHPSKFEPGERFEYCNSGYVILALIAEVVSGASFYELVAERVFKPAGMSATGFPRSDHLPRSAAIGYLSIDDGLRTNQSHLPVRGTGDGGAYSTVGDFATFWPALFGGRILAPSVVDEMVRPHHDVPSESKYYGLGFWVGADRATAMLEGYDAGVSFRSAYDPRSEVLYTVMSNTTTGAWPLVKLLDGLLADLVHR
jgi:CubicO group peptidase (beta-lactamase class C family)